MESTTQDPQGACREVRGWVFTLNNPANTDVPREWTERVSFCAWQHERGANGTNHLQGYCLFNRSRKLAYCKQLNPHAHWEPRRGSHQQALDYVTKSDTRVAGPWQYGTEPRQGKRNDLHAVQEAIQAGASDRELFEDHFPAMVKYHRGIKEYRRLCTQPRDWKTEVCVLWGKTGSGKSRYAAENYPNAFWVDPPNIRKGAVWWCGYQQESDVVIDEFYGWLPWTLLLRLLDRYSCTLQSKGGSVPFVAKRIIITSNSHPSSWYAYGPDSMQYATLRRRIERLGRLDSVDSPIEWEKDENEKNAGTDVTISRAPNYVVE